MQPQWKPLVEEATKTCQALLGEQMAAMYLRGSVPQGAAVEGLSDLDCIVYFWIYDGKNDDTSSSESLMTSAALRQWLSDVAKKLQKRFPFCTKVCLMGGRYFANCGRVCSVI